MTATAPASVFLGGALALAALSGCEQGVSGRNHDATAADEAPAAQAPGPAAAEPAPPAVPPAPRPTGPLPADAGCINAACHASFTKARHVHYAVSEGGCFACHGEDEGDHTYPLLRRSDDLCTFCHATGARMHRHAALDVGGCTGCHRPHVSDTKFLLAAPSTEALCRSCHAEPLRAHPHGPMAEGACTACHLPHGSDHEALLRGGDGPQHCFMCHRETEYALANAPYVHPPATEDCTACHDPHSSDHPHALAAPIEGACFSCHADLERQVAGATAPHAAVFTGERCANCHDAHAAGRPALLRDRQDALCLTCHDRQLEAADGRTIRNMAPLLTDREYLHGPVRAGRCDACHNVHGGSQARLLRRRFTADFYAGFDLSNYALCFDCHEQGLVTEPTTTSLTDFRDGDVNLHFVHVNRDRKGRTCRTCHEIHASDLPKHVAETVPFEDSGWAMPIRFEMTDSGGSCAPGCHEPMTYTRNLPPGTPPATPEEGTP